eukprot:TRINITY_DN10027_c0_g1_i1.p1 TRINITY_DN10027_c0_g1~~TRINITY_DN10027_c0_g1_i1.p1  ORF type:complete len:213 (+),score=72.07 TRINITY_DN10027_c0_g1_i1:46-639(+)
MSLPSVTFVTGNANKLKEVNAILSGSVEVMSRKVDLPELQGEPLDIAKEKAKEACRQLNEPVLTEDTGLCFNALQGLPGPYIKWFLEKLTVENLPKILDGFEDKSGYAQCIFTYCEPGQDPICFEGRCEGSIVPARGPRNFGWDPCFLPNESDNKTFAEMDPADKNKISHRARALEKVKAHFTALHDERSAKVQKTN